MRLVHLVLYTNNVTSDQPKQHRKRNNLELTVDREGSIFCS